MNEKLVNIGRAFSQSARAMPMTHFASPALFDSKINFRERRASSVNLVLIDKWDRWAKSGRVFRRCRWRCPRKRQSPSSIQPKMRQAITHPYSLGPRLRHGISFLPVYTVHVHLYWYRLCWHVPVCWHFFSLLKWQHKVTSPLKLTDFEPPKVKPKRIHFPVLFVP